MDDTNDIALLEQYLRGELSAERIVKLESRLEEESALSSQLTEVKEIQNGIRYARLRSNLKEIRSWEGTNESISEFESNFEQDVSEMIRIEKNREILGEIQGFEEVEIEKEAMVRSIGRYWWGVAAGVLLMVGTALFLYQPAGQLTNEELFSMYFEPYPILGVLRGETKNKLKTEAFEYYENGEYRNAIPLFERLYYEEKDTLSLLYYSISLLGDAQIDKAIANLEQLKAQNELLVNQANWYLFLAYLEKGDLEILETNVKQLEFGNHSVQGKEIIRKLKH